MDPNVIGAKQEMFGGAIVNMGQVISNYSRADIEAIVNTMLEDYTVTKNSLTGITPMITNASRAQEVCKGNLNLLPVNTIACVGSKVASLQNVPNENFRGVIVTFAYNPNTTTNGVAQLAISAENELMWRIKWGANGVWSNWNSTVGEEVYYVGGESEHQSLTGLFYELKDNTNPKTIYVNPGEYDIFAEYKALNIPSPPDDVSSSDYLNRCVFVPANTKLIGIGNVKLTYDPAKSETTKGEARTWSPLSVRYACHIENVDIYCHYGRYCIHDDSHNATDDQGVSHVYKNVHCVYDFSADDYGFNETIGFGFSQKNNIVFEDCTFIYNETEDAGSKNKSAFYGHGASGSQTENESPTINIKNCIFIAGETSTQAFRLQSLNTSPLRIKTRVDNTYIDGQSYLTIYDNSRKQAFDVEFLNCNVTESTVRTNDNNNLYPIKIYN